MVKQRRSPSLGASLRTRRRIALDRLPETEAPHPPALRVGEGPVSAIFQVAVHALDGTAQTVVGRLPLGAFVGKLQSEGSYEPTDSVR
jgi:hypothetical protein